MLIPSIDLMGGKIVQLVQGARKALEFTDFEYWIERFRSYPVVQLIDLDAAMGKGSNRALVAEIAKRLPCQVGGGIRSLEAAQAMLAAGARKVIVGSALLRQGRVDVNFARDVSRAIGAEPFLAAIDSRAGKVAVQGWKESTGITAMEMMKDLEPFCGGFLYTHIDTEGLMQGIPLEVVRGLRQATQRKLIAAGGISSREEIEQLDAMGVDAVVGMALYTGKLQG